MIATMPRAFGIEYGAINHERDPELRGEGLLSLASRQERVHRNDLAIQLYSELLSSAETPQNLRERAERRLEAQLGEGRVGDRVEVLLNRFVEEATEPTNLLAMTAAGLAFRTSRFLALSRLAANPNAGLLTRGLGARAVAGLAGFSVEAATFPVAGRVANLALGRTLDWSPETLGGELVSSFLMLGALRAGGMSAGALAGRSASLRPFLQQAGMYGGILLGHGLEVRAGLREGTSLSAAMVDGLSTLLQFNVAGRLSRGLLGEGMHRWERRIELQSEALAHRTSGNLPAPSAFFQPAFNVARPPARWVEGKEPGALQPLFMSNGEDGNNGGKGGRGIRHRSTLQGLSRVSILPEQSRSKLFHANDHYRVLNLSLRAREI
ncbi:MAG TPA: hypothetical protein VJP40_05050, partial [bacterium]|nr:hypothetical protein [bacterium]